MARRSLEKRIPERTLFEEKPEAELGLLSALAVMLFLDDIVIMLLLADLGAPELLVIVILAMNIIVLAVIFSFVRMRKVRLTDRRIFVRFGISRSSIPLTSIRSYSVEDPPSWNKAGLVTGWKGRTVYCFKGSAPFVKIEYGVKRPKWIFFNVSHLSEFMSKLKKINELQ